MRCGVIILLHMIMLRHDFYENILDILALNFPLKIISEASPFFGIVIPIKHESVSPSVISNSLRPHGL